MDTEKQYPLAHITAFQSRKILDIYQYFSKPKSQWWQNWNLHQVDPSVHLVATYVFIKHLLCISPSVPERLLYRPPQHLYTLNMATSSHLWMLNSDSDTLAGTWKFHAEAWRCCLQDHCNFALHSGVHYIQKLGNTWMGCSSNTPPSLSWRTRPFLTNLSLSPECQWALFTSS